MASTPYFLYWIFFLFSVLCVSNAQTMPISATIPPLQWINLSNLLQGTTPPRLKDAAIGYDDTSGSVIIFGGESADGFPQSQTYLLNLETLVWSTPSPPATLQRTPPARSAAIGVVDFAASNRHAFLVIGGKGINAALSDIWEYDFNNQFWNEVVMTPGGPSARWGASGGIDIRTPPISDPILPGPNNTFYLAGGFDGINPSSLSDVWRLNISGTLSSNLPNSVVGSWDELIVNPGGLPSKVGQAGTVISQQIIAIGGCSTTLVSNNSCAQPDAYIIDTQGRTDEAPSPCPAPRLSAALVPNLNQFSRNYASQVFMLVGTFNQSIWQDDGGLQDGEVAVLDVNGGTWSRVLPSGDPGTSGKPTFPSPREGAAAVSFSAALVGQSQSIASDTIMFGGRDALGNYLSEVWLLRAYNGAITPSTPRWAGFGDGVLQTGVNANGAGVTAQYISKCASLIVNPTAPTPSSTKSQSSSQSSSSSEPSVSRGKTPSGNQLFDTSLAHKLLAPLSVVLLLPAVLLFRLAFPFHHLGTTTERHMVLVYISAIVGLASYGVGIAGIAASFTTITSITPPSEAKPSPPATALTLKTAHGKVGLALFIGLYGLVPFLIIFSRGHRYLRDENRDCKRERKVELRGRANSTDTAEKLASYSSPARSPRASLHGFSSAPPSPRLRTHSWGPSSMWRRTSEQERMSCDTEESISSRPPSLGFQVLNRPSPRTRRASTSYLAVPTNGSHYVQYDSLTPRSLSDVNWLERRRSLNAVGELDYILSQANRTTGPSTAGTTDALTSSRRVSGLQVEMPPFYDIVIRFLFHVFLLGLCVVILASLWSRAPRAIFGVFLAWTITFYIFLFVFSWHGRPEKSVITTVVARLRTDPHSLPDTHTPTFQLPTVESFPFPTETPGPYIHQPPYRTVIPNGPDDASKSYSGPPNVGSDENEEDDDTRQIQMEEEMGRRDVSIITVPKRKLWITNPT